MSRSQRNAATTFAVLLSVFAFGFAALSVVAASGDDGESTASAPDVAPVAVSLTEFAIAPAMVHAEAGPVVLDVTNDGTAPHNLQLVEPETSTPDIEPGGTASLDLGELDPGDYQLLCTIPGHADQGMTATLMVMEPGEAAADGAETGGEAMDYEAMSAAMDASIAEFPAETEGTGNEPLEPTIAADGTLEYELTAAITDWEVAPGQVVQAWSYNGMVPGPEIRVAVGDHVRVTVHNELPAATDVHFHGIELPNTMDGVSPITQPAIEPGESFVYEFDAEEAAVAMYHSHHMGYVSVPNGLFGTMFIGDVPVPEGTTIGGREIPADLTVSQEIPMVLNDSGVIGLSLNGKSFPATAPVVIGKDEWMVIHYFNEGSAYHPMHLHQFPQLVYARDGIPLDEPYWADTVSVGPGERFSVLVNADEVGTWVWHCHILGHVERDTGHFGMLTAMVVE